MNYYYFLVSSLIVFFISGLSMSTAWGYILLSAFCISVIKMIISRTHYMVFLLLVEVMMLVCYTTMLVEAGMSSSSSAQVMIFMTLMVSGACLGMSMLVAVSRSFSKDMELYFLKA